MKRKLFLMSLMLMSVIGMSAQKSWNFSDADWYSGLGDDGKVVTTDYTASYTVNGLTLAAAEDMKMTVDHSKKKVNDVQYIARLKTNGQAKETGRYVSFPVDGPTDITVVVAHPSSSGDARTLNFCADKYDKDNPFATATVEVGDPIVTTVTYAGPAATIYLGSASSALNFYAISTEANNSTFYGIVGELTGGWDNDLVMTQSETDENVYTATVEGFQAAAKGYSYKLRSNFAWGGYELPADGNNVYEFTEPGFYDLTFTANVSTHTLSLEAVKTGTPVFDSYSIVGELTGGWENDVDMTQSPDDENVYTLVVNDFVAEAKGYSYKMRANHQWNVFELPASGNNVYEFTEAGTYDLTFTANIAEYTLTLDAVKQASEAQILVPEEIADNDYYYMTYSTTKALDFTGVSGIKAYTVKKNISGNRSKGFTMKAELTEVKQVPANSAVLLVADASKVYEVPFAEGEVAPLTNNDLKFVTEPTNALDLLYYDDDEWDYTHTPVTLQLVEKDDVEYVGFYFAARYSNDSDPVQLEAGDCYLDLTMSERSSFGNSLANGYNVVSLELPEPTSAEITVTTDICDFDFYYRTYSTAKALDFTEVEGLRAFTVKKNISGNRSKGFTIQAELTEVKQVPANSAVLLVTEEAKTYEVPFATEEVAPFTNNDLKYVTAPTSAIDLLYYDDDEWDYTHTPATLTMTETDEGDLVGFYFAARYSNDSDPVQLAAGDCYLDLTLSERTSFGNSLANGYKLITFTVPEPMAEIKTVEIQGGFDDDWNDKGVTLALEKGDDFTYTGTLDLSDFDGTYEFKLVVNGGGDEYDQWGGWIGTNNVTVNAPEGWGEFTGEQTNLNMKLFHGETGFNTYTVTATWVENPVYYQGWTLNIEGLDAKEEAVQLENLAALNALFGELEEETNVALTLTDAVVTYPSPYLIIEDASGAFCFSELQLDNEFAQGDVLNGVVQFTASSYYGMMNFAENNSNTASSFAALTKTEGTATPMVVTEENYDEYAENYEWRYVRFNDVTFGFSDEEQMYTFYTDLIGDDMLLMDVFYTMPEEIEVGATGYVEGFIYTSFGQQAFVPSKLDTNHTYAIVGELTGGWDNDVEMTQSEDNADIYTLTVKNFYNEGDKKYQYKMRADQKWGVFELPASGNNEFYLGDEGMYDLTFTANIAEYTLTCDAVKSENYFANIAEMKAYMAVAEEETDVYLKLDNAVVTYGSPYVIVEDASAAYSFTDLNLETEFATGDHLNGIVTLGLYESWGMIALTANDDTESSFAALTKTEGEATPFEVTEDNFDEYSENFDWRYVRFTDVTLSVFEDEYGKGVTFYTDLLGDDIEMSDLFMIMTDDLEDGAVADVEGFLYDYYGIMMAFSPTKITVKEQPSVYSIVGEFFGEDGWENDQDMTQSADDENVYTLVVESFKTEADKKYEYKLRANHKWGLYELPMSGNQNWYFPEAGDYTLTFTANVAEHTLTLDVQKNIATGINGVNVDWNDGNTYNLNGQRVSKPAKGVVIRNGQKYVVK